MLTATKGFHFQSIPRIHADRLFREDDHADVGTAEEVDGTAMVDSPSGSASHDLPIAVV